MEWSAAVGVDILILPDYLVAPWVGNKTPTLDLASALENTFKASLTAAAIKLANRATKPARVTCHASFTGLVLPGVRDVVDNAATAGSIPKQIEDIESTNLLLGHDGG